MRIYTILAIVLFAVSMVIGPPTFAGSHDVEGLNRQLPDAAAQSAQARTPKARQALSPAQEKVSGQLRAVLDKIESRGITRANARAREVATLATPFVRLEQDGRVQVYVYLDAVAEGQLNALRALELEIEITNEDLAVVQGWAPFDRIDQIAARPFVSRVTAPRYGRVRAGSKTTEGDAILRADLVRNLGVDGTGVKVGIISDGANNWPTARASGDLPAAGITTYGTCAPQPANLQMCTFGLTCNEGTAMAEIVHDIAPGAQIAVAAGIDSSLTFINRINQLVNNFGADIIVDDLGFFGEPFFADGDIAQAVAAVKNQVVFVSSAGNSADGHYEADYFNSGNGFDDHDFGRRAGGSSDATQNIVIPSGGFLVSILQWNDRFGLSGNDYDLLLLDFSETGLLAFSGAFQTGNDDPFEAFCYYNNTGSTLTAKLVVQRWSGANRRLELFNFGFLFSNSIQEYNIPSGSVFGHPGVPGVLAVGAIDASDPGHDTIEAYSSRGPSRIDFPSVQNRDKPDITGIDGVSVTGTGGFPSTFFGTSASAPHIAAIAALVKQGAPSATPTDIRNALTSSAVDLGSAGRDSTFGWGRADARAAYRVFNPISLPFLNLLLE